MKDIKEYKILFMGTPEIASIVLEKLILDGFNIVGVISQPDKPVGRKHILEATPTKKVALKYNIPVYQKEKIRKDYEFVKDIKPDLILTLAYGQILPEGLLNIPKYGCLNLHGSLLPKYRGAAPIQRALIANEKVTGMSLMEMTKEMDAGRVYAVNKIEINEDDNSSSLFLKMADAAYLLASKYLPLYLNGELKGIPQEVSEVTFAPMISKEEEHLDLSKSSKEILGYIRALSDTPGAYLYLDDAKIKIYKATIVDMELNGQLGEIVKADKSGLYIQLNDATLAILELQKEGKSRMDYKSFVNGNQFLLNKILK